ncbi:hypothetical protein PoB_003579200 [Plakobranchus ocellatus]|uniref:Uncharacterized protein n=1 Tax=Plakobranchus ocellatus TaxID=259542 RepID=A0AAV4AQS9_9GAST|nr:hypothetical protein PoB_003579200 [Plakobranchus ocellatus]
MSIHSTDRPASIPNSISDSECQQPAISSPTPPRPDTFTSPREIHLFQKHPHALKAIRHLDGNSTETITINNARPSKPKKLFYDSDDDDGKIF